jgi:hypothetical protein
MEITRQSALFFIVVFGPLVLLSYIYGVSRTDRPQDLWGGLFVVVVVDLSQSILENIMENKNKSCK